MYALVRSDPYCIVGIGFLSLACSSVIMSLDVCLSYVSLENFGVGFSVRNQLMAVVSLVELVDLKKHL